MHSYKSTNSVDFLSKSLDFPRNSWYNVITVKNERGNANEGKKESCQSLNRDKQQSRYGAEHTRKARTRINVHKDYHRNMDKINSAQYRRAKALWEVPKRIIAHKGGVVNGEQENYHSEDHSEKRSCDSVLRSIDKNYLDVIR